MAGAQQAGWTLGHAWDLDPMYVEAARQWLRPGEDSFYHDRRRGPDAGDVTEFHPGQQWTRENPPDVLYILWPPQEWFDFGGSPLPGSKRAGSGRVMREQWPEDPQRPQALLDFAVLPDKISSRESFFVIEAWKRLDPRIRWSDIMMRMPAPARGQANNLQQQIARRFREPCHLIAWDRRANVPGARDRQALACVDGVQRTRNSTRGSTPGPVDPSRAAITGSINWPDNTIFGRLDGEFVSDDEDEDDNDDGDGDDEPYSGPSTTGPPASKRSRTG